MKPLSELFIATSSLSSKYLHKSAIKEKGGAAVTLHIYTVDTLLQILADTLAILTKEFPGFPHFLKANVRIQPRLSYEYFLPNISQFIVNLPIN